MPLRALFNPSLYAGVNFTTARVYLTVSSGSSSRVKRTGRRAHSTTAPAPPLSAPWSQAPTSTAASAPSSCCPHHPHTPFNADHAYWRHHSPRLRSSLLENPSIIDKFHEIERLYRGNVEYVRRMGKENPGLLEGLAFQGQKPPFMILDCSDSRVNEQGIFDAEPGTMFTAGNIANMFDESDTSSNAVLTYAVGTLKVKHVVIMGHYGCGGVAASMAPLPPGYRERYLSPASSSSLSSSSFSSLSSYLSPTYDDPPDLAVQRWIAPIRHVYETSGRFEIRAHRERVLTLLESKLATADEISKVLLGPPGEEGSGNTKGVKGLHLHDGAFRALVEENVKANVWRVVRSVVVREHHTAYQSSLSPSSPPTPEVQPLFVHGWVYDLETGVVTDLNVSAGPPGWVPPPGGVGGGFPRVVVGG